MAWLKVWKNSDKSLLSVQQTLSNIQEKLEKAVREGANPAFVELLEKEEFYLTLRMKGN